MIGPIRLADVPAGTRCWQEIPTDTERDLYHPDLEVYLEGDGDRIVLEGTDGYARNALDAYIDNAPLDSALRERMQLIAARWATLPLKEPD